jgi:hypothetical protein
MGHLVPFFDRIVGQRVRVALGLICVEVCALSDNPFNMVSVNRLHLDCRLPPNFEESWLWSLARESSCISRLLFTRGRRGGR